MNQLPQSFVSIVPTGYVDNTTATANVIDLKGHNYCYIDVLVGSTDIAATVCKVQEADAKDDSTTLTSGADVTGLAFSGSDLPGATDDGKIVRFAFPTAGRKRYVQPVVTMDNGTAGALLAAIAYFPSSGFATPTAAGVGADALKLLPAV